MSSEKSLIKVLVIDDSAAVCAVLTSILASDPRLEVVGQAADPYEAREKIKFLNPDVLTLDIEMPRMDGITFLKNLMRLHPMPVVMISTLTQRGADKTLESLEIGAVDYLGKPECASNETLNDYATQIVRKVCAAAHANVKTLSHQQWHESQRLSLKGATVQFNKVCVIGASTGGTEAIREVLIRLPEKTPPILLAQHIPEAFSESFAKRLDSCCAIKVLQANDGMKIEPNTAYLAPGNDHLVVQRKDNGLYCKLLRSEPVNRHRPSVDMLFNSVAEVCGKSAIGVLLTGMGRDGAKGLLNLKQQGAYTVIQDEATSVVWGMPGTAAALNAADDMLPLDQISLALLNLFTRNNAGNN